MHAIDGSIRQLYLATAERSVELLRSPALAADWTSPSALPDFPVGVLAGHLARSILQVEWFLDADVPEGPASVTAARYYANLEGTADRRSPLNAAIFDRSSSTAAAGADTVARQVGEALDRLRTRLHDEPASRTIDAFGRTLRLDDYLVTRLVEMTVHLEDLALSLGIETPEPSDETLDTVIETLVAAASIRHGRRAVVRALTRRERDSADALRVL